MLAEEYGIQSVWSSNYPSSRDPFLTLAPLALASSTIRLGPLVVTAYEQHPFKTAKALATLNELCDGRANILIGGPTAVNAAMGMGEGQMVGRVRESLEVVKAAGPDQPLNYDGKYFQVCADFPTHCRPHVTKPEPSPEPPGVLPLQRRGDLPLVSSGAGAARG